MCTYELNVDCSHVNLHKLSQFSTRHVPSAPARCARTRSHTHTRVATQIHHHGHRGADGENCGRKFGELNYHIMNAKMSTIHTHFLSRSRSLSLLAIPSGGESWQGGWLMAHVRGHGCACAMHSGTPTRNEVAIIVYMICVQNHTASHRVFICWQLAIGAFEKSFGCSAFLAKMHHSQTAFELYCPEIVGYETRTHTRINTPAV